MKRWKKIAGALSGTLLFVTGCSEQAEIDTSDAASSQETQEVNSPLITGEVYSTTTDLACQRHPEMYLCLFLTTFGNESPNIWRAQVCKWGIQEGGGVAGAKFLNSPITWRVKLPGSRQVTPDLVFSATEEWQTCTDFAELDMKNLPCDKQTIIDAEVLSGGGSYHTGGLLAYRSCPPSPPAP